MARMCLNHPDAPAATMCHGCHKPLCKACVMVTAEGSFCTPECAALFRQMKSRLAGVSRKSRPGHKAVLVLLLIVLAVIAVHVAAWRYPSVRAIDVLGRFIGYPLAGEGGRR